MLIFNVVKYQIDISRCNF